MSFEYKNFHQRLFKHSKYFLLSIFVAFCAAVNLTGDFYISLSISLLLTTIIIASIFKWNIYFLQEIRFQNQSIYLKIYKYDRIVVDSYYEYSNVNFHIEMIKATKRGKSYKMIIKAGKQIYEQYEILEWKKELFEEIVGHVSKCQISSPR